MKLGISSAGAGRWQVAGSLMDNWNNCLKDMGSQSHQEDCVALPLERGQERCKVQLREWLGGGEETVQIPPRPLQLPDGEPVLLWRRRRTCFEIWELRVMSYVMDGIEVFGGLGYQRADIPSQEHELDVRAQGKVEIQHEWKHSKGESGRLFVTGACSLTNRAQITWQAAGTATLPSPFTNTAVRCTIRGSQSTTSSSFDFC